MKGSASLTSPGMRKIRGATGSGPGPMGVRLAHGPRNETVDGSPQLRY